jgi:superfamily II DNA or RNA helicase/HKD family nuclease/SOS-response transcriptional repressor LexA
VRAFPTNHLTVGGSDPFLPSLLQAINYATSISIAAAFIRQTGLNLIFSALEDALLRGAKVRILTGDYLGITEPKALRHLLLLQTRGAEIKVFESKAKQSFHMKAYIFLENATHKQLDGCAFIGSSNISRAALLDGLEWNLSVALHTEPEKFITVLVKYEELYNGHRCIHLNHEWIDEYEKRIPKTSTVKLVANADDEDFEPTPEPNIIQQQALTALHRTRLDGYQRGLVVMATGTGKTWLSAFDSLNVGAKRILFVAHREEILDQAEKTFIRMYPNSRIGRYAGKEKQHDVDLVFASIQTLGKKQHLEVFSRTGFDYVVVDEFHHASANSYQKLLSYFTPKFMLGLTATPERSDQSDILSLCDDNLVFDFGLFDGIESEILCPFDYQGIADTVDYTEISWRNGKFDPEQLENKLATISRAKHNLKHWQKHKLSRTLGFCVSTKHADFMAKYFSEKGVKAVAVHSKSNVPRNLALSELSNGDIDIIFSVDLFNEGVALPSIDTVMMLRPTDSKIVFLQQLGRGLRRSKDTSKERLVILDFIGNHISFFRKVDALFRFGITNNARKKFIADIKKGRLTLPKNCFVNIELSAINILQQLIANNIDKQTDIYIGLKESFDRRPTLSEFYHAGGAVDTIRKEYGSWFAFLSQQQDLDDPERAVFDTLEYFLSEVETTNLTKSFKLVLLEALLELDGFREPAALNVLAMKSLNIFKRHRPLLQDLPVEFRDLADISNLNEIKWLKYWQDNPVNAWVGGNKKTGDTFFKLKNDKFAAQFTVPDSVQDTFSTMLQEIVNYRFLQYEGRTTSQATSTELAASNVIAIDSVPKLAIPYFTDLKIACGHFKSSEHESSEMIEVPECYGKLDPSRHFVANATGNSMNGGKHPIKHGDLLLLERITPEHAGSISGKTVAIERMGATGDDQYLLRNVSKIGDQQYRLIAQNDDYEPIDANEDMKTLAFLKAVIDPADVYIHKEFMRQEIPSLFGLEFNKGSWESGHVRPKDCDEQFLLVTLNKQGKASEHQYHDYFVDQTTFHWQSQASTRSDSAKGRALQKHGNVHLFVRKNKLTGGTASPFYYIGKLDYQSHHGEAPMSVTWLLQSPLPPVLLSHLQI